MKQCITYQRTNYHNTTDLREYLLPRLGLLRSLGITWEQNSPAVVIGSIVVNALTCCALLQSLCYLKAVMMNMHFGNNQKYFLFELRWCIFLLYRNTIVQEISLEFLAISTITQILVGLKLWIPKTEAVEANMSWSTWRVSGEVGISQSCVFYHLRKFLK